MSNMSYCRWGNTYRDLQDCFESMGDVETKDLSESERRYKKKLLQLCYEMADEYRLFIDTEEEENEINEENEEG